MKLGPSFWWVSTLRCLLIVPLRALVRRCVSGKRLCSGCSQPLGKGAAMNIDTLGLFFHMQCFKVLCCHFISTHSDGSADENMCSLNWPTGSWRVSSAEGAVGRWATPPPAPMFASATVTWAAMSATSQPGVSGSLGWVWTTGCVECNVCIGTMWQNRSW